MRDRNQLDAPSGTMPRRAKPKPNLALVEASRMSSWIFLAVPGIDLIISGPGDLAADLAPDFSRLAEYGSYDDPELDTLVAQIEEHTRRAGRWLGGVARPARAAPGRFARGYDFVTVTADIWLLGDGAKRALAEAQGQP